jgi:hypothetical protein
MLVVRELPTIAKLCELIERRFEEKVKKSDIVERVGRLRGSYRRSVLEIPGALRYVGYLGALPSGQFKYLALTWFYSGWTRVESVIERIASDDDREEKLKYLLEYTANLARVLDDVDSILDYHRVLATSPIASRVYYNYLSRLFRRDDDFRGFQGNRVVLTGVLGSGKTTLAYLSLYSFFRALDFGIEESKRLATLFYANTVKEAAELVAVTGRLAEEGLIVPATIFDDAAVTLSKYSQVPWASDRETMRLATEFVKYFQISREGVGCIVVVSPPNMVVKGVRETADTVIEGVSYKDELTYSLWMEWINWYKPFVSGNPFDREVIATYRSRMLLNFAATVHPPLILHRDVVSTLTAKKLGERERIVQRMLEALRSVERRERRRKKRRGKAKPKKEKHSAQGNHITPQTPAQLST